MILYICRHRANMVLSINYGNYLNLQPVLVLHILTDRYKNKYKNGRLEINETNADKIYYMYLQYIDS
jgi:hypothetical protein